MTILDSASGAATDPDDQVPVRLLGRLPTQSIIVIGLLAAAQAALGGLLVVLAVAAAVWAAADRVGAGWAEMMRVATDIWLAGHGTTIALPTGEFSLLPLGLTLLLVWWARACADRVLDLCDDGRGSARGYFVRCLVVYVLGYTTLVGAAAGLVGTESARPLLGSALLGGAAVSTLGMGLSGYPLWRGEGPGWQRLEALGGAVRTGVRWWLGAAAALVLLRVVLTWGRVVDIQQALQPDFIGHLGLILLQLVLAPVAVLWSGSWLAGPGFSVGQGTSISPFGTELAPVPALPMLAALPAPGPGSVWLWWAPMLVVLGGFVAGIGLSRLPVDRVDQRWWLTGARVASGAALLALPLLWAGTGAVGPDRLEHVGPRVLVAALCVGLEIGAGTMLGMGLAPVVMDGRLGEAVGGALDQAASSRNTLVARFATLATRLWEALGVGTRTVGDRVSRLSAVARDRFTRRRVRDENPD